MAVKRLVRPSGNKKVTTISKINNKTDYEKKSIEALDSYKQYLTSERNYSVYTINSYLKDISEFDDFLKAEGYGSLLSVQDTGASRNYVLREKYLV